MASRHPHRRVAEELLLRLLLQSTEVTLDLRGLLDDGVQEALGSFRENVYEDLDHEWLYEPEIDGFDQSPEGGVLGVAPMSVGDWFTPFNSDRPVRPYATEVVTGDGITRDQAVSAIPAAEP